MGGAALFDAASSGAGVAAGLGVPNTGGARPVVVGVLALQGDVAEHVAALESLGVSTVRIRTPEQLAQVDALIIPGGESTTIGRLLDIFELRKPLQERLAAGMPAYGSCAGMITLGSTILDGREDQVPLGALDIVVRRNAFGRQVDSFETELDFDGFAEAGLPADPLHAVFIRAPWVQDAGSGVRVLARAPGGEPVAVLQGNVLATSFHPEISADDRVHRLFLKLVEDHVRGRS